MRKSEKERLIKKYMVNIPKLTSFQTEWIRKETAHYILVSKDNDGKHHGYCTRCKNETNLPKTKHRDKINCPVCGKEMEVIHEWRVKSFPETIDWIAIPKAIDNTTLMLRYVVCFKVGKHEEVEECARLVYNPITESYHTFEMIDGEWKYSSRRFFAEYCMWNFRKWCCLPADGYKPLWKKELKKLDCLKDFEFMNSFAHSSLYAHTSISVLVDRKNLYEKLCKAGLTELAKDDFDMWGKNYYARKMCINPISNKTSLKGMLGINKNQLKLLRENQTIKAYQLIKIIPNINQELIDLCLRSKVNDDVINQIINYRLSLEKTLKYFIKTGCNQNEWIHYVSMLIKLRYKLDKSNLYPKDFRKSDNRVSNEYMRNLDIIKQNEDILHNNLIKNISIGLHNNKELCKFFIGSDGLQVLIPETVDELRREGKALHNCLGTYVDRYAEGKTLIFFVRRIEDPTAPYIAMEYCHGRVVQCRYDYNKRVEDEKIIGFTNALAEALAKEKILVA